MLEKNIQKLAEIISKDLGKVHDDAVGEIRRGIENVEYACGIGEILKGEFNKNISTSVDSWSEFSPLGPVLGITHSTFLQWFLFGCFHLRLLLEILLF